MEALRSLPPQPRPGCELYIFGKVRGYLLSMSATTSSSAIIFGRDALSMLSTCLEGVEREHL